MSNLETLSKLIIKEFNIKELQEIPENLENDCKQEIMRFQLMANDPQYSELEQKINFSYSKILGEAVYLLMQIRRNKSEKTIL